jgi:hypothetical protein
MNVFPVVLAGRGLDLPGCYAGDIRRGDEAAQASRSALCRG